MRTKINLDLEEITISLALFNSLVAEINNQGVHFGHPDSLIILPFGTCPPKSKEDLSGYCGVTVRPSEEAV